MGRLDRWSSQVCLASFLVLQGCSDPEGGDTATGDLSSDFRVIANPSTTTVFARLQSEALPSIRLPDGDELGVATGAQVKVMGYAIDPVNGNYYTTSLVAPALDQNIVISLTRDGAANAPDSRVTMPAAVRLSAPTIDSVIVVGTTMEVSWAPSGTDDDITIVLSTTECTGGGSTAPQGTEIVGDPGTASIVIPASLLPASLPFAGLCAVSVRVERTRFGTPDPAYAPGGTVIARQIDFRQIFVVPED
jgi:hypothetical protein